MSDAAPLVLLAIFAIALAVALIRRSAKIARGAGILPPELVAILLPLRHYAARILDVLLGAACLAAGAGVATGLPVVWGLCGLAALGLAVMATLAHGERWT